MKPTARHLAIAATTALMTACAPKEPVGNALYRAPDGPIGRVLWSDDRLRDVYGRFVKSCVAPSSVPPGTMMGAVDARDARLHEMQQDGSVVETLIGQELHQPWLWDSHASASLRRAY